MPSDRTDLSCEEDAFCFDNGHDFNTQRCGENFPDDGSDEGDDEFEFSFVTRDTDDSSTISADEIFYDGQIRLLFPVFGKEIFPGGGAKPPAPQPVRLPLGKLLVEERRRRHQASTSSSSRSSSEADELHGVTPGTYCVWKPKTPPQEAAEQQRQKSNLTGSSSKRWRLRELLGRSYSDGKETFAFRMLSKSTSQFAAAAASGGGAAAAAVEANGVKSGGEKRRDAVGHFAM